MDEREDDVARERSQTGREPAQRTPAGPRVGVVGATGAVGEVLIQRLLERRFAFSELRLLASERSVGQTLEVGGVAHEVVVAEPDSLEGLDVVFFAATGELSKRLGPAAVQRGAVVIDKSSSFRMAPGVPLVIPEVNAEALADHDGIIACPNCTTIGLVMTLAPLARVSRLERVFATTLQAVSGAGRPGLEELAAQLRDRAAEVRVFASRIAGNVVALCDSALEDGRSSEEEKLVEETRKILGMPELAVHATCLRVPVEIGHSASVVVEAAPAIAPDAAREAWAAFPGVEVVDDWPARVFPTPLDVAGRDEVLVGRARRDEATGGLAFFEVSDNLRKGAATNAVQIAEALFA